MEIKRLIKYLLILLSLVTCILIYKIVTKEYQKTQIAKTVSKIPNFLFQTTNHQNFEKKNIKDTLGRVCIILFSPDCEHCQYMAESIVKHKNEIQKVNILMITPFGDSLAVSQFADTYGLNKLSNVVLLLDSRDEFPFIFGSNLVPSFFVYENNRLIKSIKGETKIDNLIH